ncbi:tripartite tricarboxylate transporter TctB family protein [bacterium]|nr:tripartite tricarboxylate transporter TctB family protein [bacterium]
MTPNIALFTLLSLVLVLLGLLPFGEIFFATGGEEGLLFGERSVTSDGALFGISVSRAQAAPLLFGALLVVAAIMNGVSRMASSHREGGSGDEPSSFAAFAQIALLFLLAAGALLAIPVGGFFPVTLLFFLGGQAILGERRALSFLIGGGVWTLIVYGVFVTLLQVPLPGISL